MSKNDSTTNGKMQSSVTAYREKSKFIANVNLLTMKMTHLLF